MLVDLIRLTAADGMELDGAFFEPSPDAKPDGPIDAVLCIHGSGRAFYTAATSNMANDLRNRGYAALTLNTRGHDTVWVDRQTGVAEGNAYEILDTGRQDLRAGIDYLSGLGYRRIGILGHSMGAVKVAYYAATEADARVAAVIPVSPVRLSCSYYLESEDAEEFRANLEMADRMEAEGRALDLFYVDFPIKEMFSAAAYLDKHGPLERYNIIQHAPNIRVPMFVLSGSLETHTRLLDVPQDMITAAVNSPRAEYLVLEGGNHSLTNMMPEAGVAVLDWLASLSAVGVSVAAD
ncbi:MAG: alpha/beta fold hydrolase [Chloroflexi bacterium]|nr:alpha/beta fold hydrolase [Chloroflexota bacterium]